MNKIIELTKSSYKIQSITIISIILMLTLSIWIFGNHIGLTHFQSRLLCVLIIFIFCFLLICFLWWLSHHKESQLFKSDEQYQAMPLEKLAKSQIDLKIKNALALMRSSKILSNGFKLTLQRKLPWFLLLGKSSAGKSTILRNSKIHFPFSSELIANADDQLNQFSSIEFWLANEAVFIDTQNCDCGEDQKNPIWFYILKQLKRNRTGPTLQGIIYVIDMQDVLAIDENSMQKEASQIRREIVTVTQLLGYHIPIFFIINKIDRLPGMIKFVQSCNEQQQAILGFSVNGHQDIAKRLQLLCQQLTNTILERLSHQLNEVDKIDQLNMIEEFRLFTIKLHLFISLICKENPYQITPNYKAIYLTSAINSYGINELFSSKLIQNKSIIEKTRINLYNTIWSRTLGICVGCIVIISVCGIYNMAYSTNASLLKNAVIIISHLIKQDDVGHVPLQQAFNLYQSLNEYNYFIPWYRRLGLYRGYMVIDDIRQLLLKQITLQWMCRINNQLESILQNDAHEWQRASALQRQQLRGNYYAVLKAYLMLHFPQKVEINYFDQILSGPSFENLNLLDSYHNDQAIINYYLSQSNQLDNDSVNGLIKQVNIDLIKMARSQLNTSSALINFYSELRDNGIAQLGTISLSDLMGADNNSMYFTNERLPKLFTKMGWQGYMLPQIMKLSITDVQQDDWVISMPLNDSTNQNDLHPVVHANQKTIEQLQQLYFDDYQSTWAHFLNSIQFKKINSIDDTIKNLQVLSARDSVSDKLFEMIVSNLGMINKVDEANTNTIQSNNYLQSLSAIQVELEPLLISADEQTDSLRLASELLSGTANNTAIYRASLISEQNAEMIDDAQLKQAFLHVLLLPVQEAWCNVLQSAHRSLTQQWQTNIVSNYQQTLAHKAPFATSNEDASVEDAAHFLNPDNGLLMQFIYHQLAPFLIQDGREWREKTWLNHGLGLSPQLLITLQTLQNISHDLFNNPDKPGLTFYIYPEPTPRVDEISITMNGQVYRYRNEPQRWQLIKWQTQDNVILKVSIANYVNPIIIEENGMWGLFQLLRHAELSPVANSLYRVSWSLNNEDSGHIKIGFLIKPVIQQDFINDLILHSISLPSHL